MKADGPYSLFAKVEECFLGSHPPMVTGIKCYPECPRGSNIILDFNVCCFDDLNVVVRTGIGPASTTVQVRVPAPAATRRRPPTLQPATCA